jgi:hypothetical protein
MEIKGNCKPQKKGLALETNKAYIKSNLNDNLNNNKNS